MLKQNTTLWTCLLHLNNFLEFLNSITRLYGRLRWLYIAAAIAFHLILKPGKHSNKVISGILALFWFWIGVVYHWSFFASINPAARLFGALFVLQGMIFVFEGIIRDHLDFSFGKDWRSAAGIVLMLFGPIVYPTLGYFLGHTYPSTPTFDLPCPITIFTIGALFLANCRRRRIFAHSRFDWNGCHYAQEGKGSSENRCWSSGFNLKICWSKSFYIFYLGQKAFTL